MACSRISSVSHERCAGSMSLKLGGVEACRPLPAILQAGLAQHTGAAFVSTSARACACGSAMEARRRALQRSGCSDTSTQLLATTSLFCCGIVAHDAGPARTGVAASRIGDARCCDGCARCRVGSAAGCCPHASKEIKHPRSSSGVAVGARVRVNPTFNNNYKRTSGSGTCRRRRAARPGGW